MCTVKFECYSKWSYKTFKQEILDSHMYGHIGVFEQ